MELHAHHLNRSITAEANWIDLRQSPSGEWHLVIDGERRNLEEYTLNPLTITDGELDPETLSSAITDIERSECHDESVDLTKHEAYCYDLGFEDPLDESPIENPDGWYSGSVEHTGGGMMCRTWSTWTGDDEKPPGTVEFSVIYNITDSRVGLDSYTWQEIDDGTIHPRYNEHIKTVSAPIVDEPDDRTLAHLAGSLMQDVNRHPNPADLASE